MKRVIYIFHIYVLYIYILCILLYIKPISFSATASMSRALVPKLPAELIDELAKLCERHNQSPSAPHVWPSEVGYLRDGILASRFIIKLSIEC